MWEPPALASEKESAVKSAVAESADKLRVDLKNGRVQEIAIKRLDGTGNDIAVSIAESKHDSVLRTESVPATRSN